MYMNQYFIIGHGWMEQTVLFYGMYADRELAITGLFTYNYNLPVAYLVTVAAYFLTSLAFMVRK